MFSLHSIRGWLKSLYRSKGRTYERKSCFRRLSVDQLEDRTLLANVLPQPIVANPNPVTNGSNPMLIIDPVDANKVIAVYTTGSELGILFSVDQGTTWDTYVDAFVAPIPSGLIVNELDPNTAVAGPPSSPGTAFAVAATPTVAMDRNENFYVAYIQRNVANTSGALVVATFDFQGITPYYYSSKVIYSWFGEDPALNPYIAVDNNPTTSYTDPLNPSAVQPGDPTSGGAIYVAWNTDAATPQLSTVVTAPTPTFDQSVLFQKNIILVSMSVDGGQTYTTPQYVSEISSDANNFGSSAYYADITGGPPPVPTFSGGTNPQIFFTQAASTNGVSTAASAFTPTLTAGELFFLWSAGSDIIYDSTALSSTTAPAGIPAASVYEEFMSSGGFISDADPTDNSTNPSPNPPATADTPDETSFSSSTVSIAGVVSYVTVSTTGGAGGAGYTSAPAVTFTGGGVGATQATGIASIVGKVSLVTMTSSGSGYTTVPTVEFVGGGGTGAAGVATRSVLGATITNGGTGYAASPTVTISGGGGSGATATATVVGGVVTGVTITNPGLGYTSAPTIDILGGDGTFAGSVSLDQFITGVTITNPGAGYTSVPLVLFTGGTGTGAAATATISGSVTGVTLTSPGSGYTSAPTIVFSGGGGAGAIATAKLDFPLLKDLAVTVNLEHPHLDHLSIFLVAPDGVTAIPLVRNRVDGFGNPTTPTAPGTPTMGLPAGSNLGVLNGVEVGTVFSQLAPRAINDPANSAPYVGTYRPEGAVTTSGGFGGGFALSGVIVTNGGSGYTSAPGVNISGSASGIATIAGGVVTGVVLTDPGGSYTSAFPPTISFFGGGGTGAAATPTFGLDYFEGWTPTGDGSVLDVTLTNAGSGYLSNPYVTFDVSSLNIAYGTTTVAAGAVTGINFTSNGDSYTGPTAPTATFRNGGGTGASATAKMNVTGANITNGGSGYTFNPTVTFLGGGATTQATATARMSVAGVTITNGGSGYPVSSTQAVTFSAPGGGGITAAGTATINSLGVVTSITITTPGTRYTSNPTITVGGGGTGFQGVPSFSLESLNIAGGSGYTSAPTITITGGGGVGAAATATLSNVNGALINAGGSGYTAATTVSFGGPGTGAIATPRFSVSGYTGLVGGDGYSAGTTVVFSGGTPTTGATATPKFSVSTLPGSVTIDNGGSGYTVAPNVTFAAPPAGTGNATATGFAVLGTGAQAGKVVSVTVTSGGSGYTSAPNITFSAPASGTTALATATSFKISGINITSGGSGYVTAPTISFGNVGSGSGAAATPTFSISGINFSNFGSGYTPASTIDFVDSNGTGATAIPTFTVAGSTIVNAGSGYRFAAQLTFAGGTPATAAFATPKFSVSGMTITNGGSGYTSAPTVTFSGGGATTNATGIATVAGGIVTGVTITNPGSGYTSTPTVSFSLGGGTGAAATPTFSLAGLFSLAPGTDYLSFPTLTLTGGGGTGATLTPTLKVTGYTITSPGSGYTSAPTVVFNDVSNSRVAATGTVSSSKGLVLGVYNLPMGTRGTGYTLPPTVSFGGGGTGATGFATMDGVVTGVAPADITTPGATYVGGETVTFTGGGGTGAAGTVSTVGPGGEVTGIVISNGGSGYTSAPTFTIAGGDGTAAGTATFAQQVVSVTVTASGSGYTGMPTNSPVTFTNDPADTTGAGAALAAGIPLNGFVTGITFTPGSGYTSAPAVTITRNPVDATGSGATAKAVYDGLNGTWKLQITDYFDDRLPAAGPFPTTALQSWGLKFVASDLANFSTGFGGDTQITIANPVPAPTSVDGTSSTNYPNYPTTTVASPVLGIGPSVSFAMDQTLGAYSQYQGRIYITYTGNGFYNSDSPDDTDIYIIYSDNGGSSWSGRRRVNQDRLQDNFSEGDRPQFQSQVAVDPLTGTVVVMWYDAREDASHARVATYLAYSIDGGVTFSPEVYLNQASTATNAITQELVTIEPIPSNLTVAGALGFGERQGLAVYGGKVLPMWSGNLNIAGSEIWTTSTTTSGTSPVVITPGGTTIPGGPRIIQGDMGPVVQDYSDPVNYAIGYNDTFNVDGTRQLTAFYVKFDRPVDISTFTPDAVQLFYRDPYTPASTPPIDISSAITSITPLAQTVDTPVTNVTVTDGGSGYNFAPSVSFVTAPGDSGSGAQGTAIFTRVVQNVTISAFGNIGYTSAPTVTFTAVPGTPGSGATGYATIAGGKVTSVVITNRGSGYTSAPIVTFTGGGFTTAATATSVLNGIVTGVTITKSGKGYSTPPTVVFGFSGSGTGAAATATIASPFGRATQFLVNMEPQSRVGTYSYTVGPNIRDTIRNTSISKLAPMGDPIVQTTTDGFQNFDSVSTVTQAITVNTGTTDVVSSVTVKVNLSSQWSTYGLYYLELTLIAPDGTRVPLTQAYDIYPGNDLRNTTFDDDAATSIVNIASPGSTSYRPSSPLSVLSGKAVDGTWQLEVYNLWPNYVLGDLENWTLSIQPGNIASNSSLGNRMDQNSNAVVGESNVDAFAIPRPLLPLSAGAGAPFQPPYDPTTLPLMIPGPHIISTTIPAQANTAVGTPYVVSTPRSTTPLSFNSGPALSAGTVVSQDLTPSGAPTFVTKVSVTLDIDYPSVQDLDISLIGPVDPVSGLRTKVALVAAGDAISPSVTSIAITNAGSGYTLPPTVSFTGGGGGTGAQAVATIDVNGVVDSVTITDGGSGYTFPPNVVFTRDVLDTTGGGAAGTATIASGFNRTSFDDSAANTISATYLANGDLNLAPYTNSFQPAGYLGNFYGENGNATWSLEIVNTNTASAPKVFGTLNSWSLAFQTPTLIRSGPAGSTGTVASQTVTVATGASNVIASVKVGMNLTYPNVEDLRLILIAPDGERVLLAAENTATGINYTETTFDDAAPTYLGAGTAPYTGSFKPASSLTAALAGKNPNGIWRLVVVDTNESIGTSGSLTDWTLTIQTSTATTDQLVFNGTNSSLDVVFDRDMKSTSFTAASILQMTGPYGNVITGPFTVTPNPAGTSLALSRRTFRIGFPTQSISGYYALSLASSVQSALGHAIDNNLNAGLDMLRGTASATSTLTQSIFDTGPLGLALVPGQSVLSLLTITDPFIINQDSTHRIQLRLNITHGNIPDLSAKLIAPDGTVIQLFTNAGTVGPAPHANFTDTLFDDFATIPVQSGQAPFNLGPYNPQKPLSALDTKGSTGVWKLVITNAGGSTGTLNNWKLILPKPTPSTGLGEPVADRTALHFHIFTQDPTLPQSHSTMTAVGPSGINGGKLAGRITGVAVDPSDPSGNTVFVGAASGGIWKTYNFLTTDPDGPTYIPLTDSGPAYTLNTGSIAVFGRNNDPAQSIVFVATGEGDSLTKGVGFLRSMDGGSTWRVLDSTNNEDSPVLKGISAMSAASRDHLFRDNFMTSWKITIEPVALPSGELIVYAALSGVAATQGLWRSVDTGRHWTRVPFVDPATSSITNADCTDFVLPPNLTTSAGAKKISEWGYAAFEGYGVFRAQFPSVAGSFTIMPGNVDNANLRDGDAAFNPGPVVPILPTPSSSPNGPNGRIVLAAVSSTSDPLANYWYRGWLYALVDGAGAVPDALYMTKDGGLNWTHVHLPLHGHIFPGPPATVGTPYPSNDETRADNNLFLTSYAMSLVIDPTNPNIVYITGIRSNVAALYSSLIRVDTTTLSDAHALVAFDNSNTSILPGSADIQTNTVGGVTFKAATATEYGLLPPGVFSGTPTGPYLNFILDPENPFTAPSVRELTGVSDFTNTGFDASWMSFATMLAGTTDVHRSLAIVDPLTGKTRLIFTNDQGVFSGVDDGAGTLVSSLGSFTLPSNARNGNLQILQMNSGTMHPTSLAADLSGIINPNYSTRGGLFYGMADGVGNPTSAPDTLATGNLNWTGTPGDGSFAVVDPTGSGTVYQYKSPTVGNFLEFFSVSAPGSAAPISRTGGSGGSLNPDTWPLLGYFAVNPANPKAVVISAGSGAVYLTTDEGVSWTMIASALEMGSQGLALAFGAPASPSNGLTDTFIYNGTQAGKIFVTETGGTPWTDITDNLLGSVQTIVTDPTPGSHKVYVVTSTGVYYKAQSVDSLDPITGLPILRDTAWSVLTGNLFTITRKILGTNDTTPALAPGGLTSLAVDWRYVIPRLYVGGFGGVYRSTDSGVSWISFPAASGSGASAIPDGGLLPNVRVTHLDLAVGAFSTDGSLPDQATGLNMLAVSTYGRGMFAIRLDINPPAGLGTSGPYVAQQPASAAMTADGKSVVNLPPLTGNAASIDITFGTDAAPETIDPATFGPSDVVLMGPNPTGAGMIQIPVQITDNEPVATSRHFNYRLSFNATKSGTYTLSIGPTLSSPSGFLMNQNQNAINGEASADKYVTTFQLLTVNQAPTVTPIPTNSMNIASGTWAPINFTVADAETAASSLIITYSSSNLSVLPNSGIALTPGSAGAWSMVLTPTSAGTTFVTIQATDAGGRSTYQTFELIVQTDATLPFTDDFNRLDDLVLGTYWTTKLGAVQIVSNTAQTNSALAHNIATLNGVSETDVKAQTCVFLKTGVASSAGLVARYTGAGDTNMYKGILSGTANGIYTAEIWRVMAGAAVKLSSASVAAATGALRFEVINNSLKLFFDDVLVTYAYDSMLTGPGAVGVRGTQGCILGDFSADAILNPTATLEFQDALLLPTGAQLAPPWEDRAGNFSGSSIVASTTVTSGGTGYSQASVNVIFSAPPVGGTTATGVAVVSGGSIIGVTVTSGGAGYTSAPTMSFTGGTGAVGTTTLGTNVSGKAALNLATLHNLSQTDVMISANVKLGTLGTKPSVGLVARYTGGALGSGGDTNLYEGALVRISGQTYAQISRNVNGVRTMLNGTNGQLVTGAPVGGLLEFHVIGSSLKLFLDTGLGSALVANASDTVLTSGSVGIRSTQGATFTDFGAYAPTTIKLTSSTGTATSQYGQDVVYTATISPESGVTFPATGTSVNFALDGGGTYIQNVPVIVSGNIGTATFDPQLIPLLQNAWSVGTHTITATFVDPSATLPNVFLTSPWTQTVTKATTKVVFTTAGPVASVNVTDGGSGYMSAPTVTFDPPPSGTTATGVAVLGTGGQAGQVVRIDITNVGSGYTLAPNITFGSGMAAATAVLATSPVPYGQPGGMVITATLRPNVPLSEILPVSTGYVPPTGTVSSTGLVTTTGQSLMLGQATYTLPNFNLPPNAAAYRLHVSYAGNSNFLPLPTTTANDFTLVANKADVAVTITPSAPTNTLFYGEPLTFTVEVSPAVPFAGMVAPTGAVTFMDGTNKLAGTFAISSAGSTSTYIFTPSTPLSAGTHTISVSYAGDTKYKLNSASSFTYDVKQITTSTVLTSSSIKDGAVFISGLNTPVIFTATVSNISGTAAIPTGGAVIFYRDGTMPADAIGTVALVNGVAKLSYAGLTLGSHTIFGQYTGSNIANPFSSSFAPSVVMPGLNQTVRKVSTTAVSSTTVAPSPYSSAVNFTATVTGSGMNLPPGGGVTFYDGPVTFLNGVPVGTVLGTVATPASTVGSVSTYTFSSSTLTAGVHSIYVVYGGDAGTNYAPSISTALSRTVTAAPTTTSTVTLSNPSAVYGSAIAFEATVTDTVGITPDPNYLTFKSGTTTLVGTKTLVSSTANSITYSFTPTTPLNVGSHVITAAYVKNGNLAASATPTALAVTQVITQVTTEVTLVTSSATSAPSGGSYYGQQVKFTATVAATNSALTPTGGTVTFKAGTTVLGTGVLTNGTAEYTTTFTQLAVDTSTGHSIAAVYNGSTPAAPTTGNFASSTAVTSVTIDDSGSGYTSVPTVTFSAPPSGAGNATATGIAVLDGAGNVMSVTITKRGSGYTSAPTITFTGGTPTTEASATAMISTTVAPIFQKVDPATTSTTLTVVPVSPVTLNTPTLVTGTFAEDASNPSTYYYAITAIQGDVETLASIPKSIILTASQKASKKVSLSWNAVAGASGYNIYRSSVSGGFTVTRLTAMPITTTTYADNGMGGSAGTPPTTATAASNYGQPVIFTATIAITNPSPGAPGSPTGTVVFKDGMTPLTGTVTLKSSTATTATYALATTATQLAAGNHTITATATPTNANILGSGPAGIDGITAATNYVVNQAVTATTLTSSAIHWVEGAAATLTAKVANKSNAAAPTGTVTFTMTNVTTAATYTKDVTLTSGTASVSTALLLDTMTSNPLVFSDGEKYSLDVTYNSAGTGNFAASTAASTLTQPLTQIVRKASQVALLAPVVAAGSASAALTAVVSGSSGTPTGTVRFYEVIGGTFVLLGTQTVGVDGKATCTTAWSNAAHTIVVIYGEYETPGDLESAFFGDGVYSGVIKTFTINATSGIAG